MEPSGGPIPLAKTVGWAAARVAEATAQPDPVQAARAAIGYAAVCTASWAAGTVAVPSAAAAGWIGGMAKQRMYSRALLHDLFSPARVVRSSWLTPRVARLAQAIYDCRSFDRLPELASALEHAGCRDRSLLDHCRGQGLHCCGCWVVDFVLGRS